MSSPTSLVAIRKALCSVASFDVDVGPASIEQLARRRRGSRRRRRRARRTGSVRRIDARALLEQGAHPSTSPARAASISSRSISDQPRAASLRTPSGQRRQERRRARGSLPASGGRLERRLCDGASCSQVATANHEDRDEHAGERDRRAGPEGVDEAVRERDGHRRPSATASSVVATAIVERSAIPTAPPICCEVLIRPDARPASCGFVPASAAIVTGTNANGIATPRIRKPGKRSAQ